MYCTSQGSIFTKTNKKTKTKQKEHNLFPSFFFKENELLGSSLSLHENDADTTFSNVKTSVRVQVLFTIRRSVMKCPPFSMIGQTRTAFKTPN